MAKRIPTSLEAFFPSVVLFREDVEEILRVLTPAEEELPTEEQLGEKLTQEAERRKLSVPTDLDYSSLMEKFVQQAVKNVQAVKIVDDEFVYDSIDDLKQRRGDVVKTLTVSRREPMIYVHISPREVKLYAEPDTPQAKAMFCDIKPILDRSKRWWCPLRITMGIRWIILVVILVLVIGTFPDLSAFLLLLVSYLYLSACEGSFSRVFLTGRAERKPSFFARHWEHIVLSTFMIIVGILLKAGWDALTTDTKEPPTKPSQQAAPTEDPKQD